MRSSCALLAACVALAASAFAATPAPNDTRLLVRTPAGWVRGTAMGAGAAFRAFRGIPYAEAPVGERRFRPPAPHAPWEGVLEADEEGPPCLQVSHLTLSESGDEDCLYLNVFAPWEGEDLPVLVFMHGGSFLEGHGGLRYVEPQSLLQHPLVLVSFNYRLGPFGFLSTEDAAMPGNYGLKDALLVLRWVRAAAAAFGGSPERVTLAGASAGAAAAHLLALSPAARPLVSGALLSSGGALAAWAVAPPGTASARRVAPHVACPARGPSPALAACLRRVDAALLLRTYKQLRPNHVPPLFAPVVETHRAEEADGDEPLVTESPLVMARRGAQVPLVLGLTSDESLEWGRNLHEAVHRGAFEESVVDDEMAKISPVRPAGGAAGAARFVKRLRSFYLRRPSSDGQLFTEDDASALFSDALFNYPAYRVATLQADARTRFNASVDEDAPGAVFLYIFAFRGRVSEMARRGGPVSGVVHGDDLLYVLGRQFPHPVGWPNASEAAVGAALAEAWASFAADGAPRWRGERWPAVEGGGDAFRYMEIGHEARVRRGPPFPKRMAFWEKLRRTEGAQSSASTLPAFASTTNAVIIISALCAWNVL